MKSSRAALGITAFILGAVAAICTGAKREITNLYYTTGGVLNVCAPISVVGPTPCPIGGTGCYITINESLYQLYTGQAQGMCITPLAEGGN